MNMLTMGRVTNRKHRGLAEQETMGLQHYHYAHLCALFLVDFSGPGIGSENATLRLIWGYYFSSGCSGSMVYW